MDILFIVISLMCGYALAVIHQRRKTPASREIPQQEPAASRETPQQASYLEDKIWYESELNFLFK